jgi:hypothetical protein
MNSRYHSYIIDSFTFPLICAHWLYLQNLHICNFRNLTKNGLQAIARAQWPMLQTLSLQGSWIAYKLSGLK